MKNWNWFVRTSLVLCVALGISIFLGGASTTFAQGRVNKYTIQTDFDGAGQWNDLSYSDDASYIGDEIFFYSNQDEDGNTITANLPFDFKYDNTTESQGTQLTVGPGWISFGDMPQYYNTWQDQSTDPGIMYFWAGEYNPSYGYGYVNSGSGVDIGQPYYGIYSEVDGSAPNRVFTIQENNVHMDFGTGYNDAGTSYLCSMQIKLYEGSGIIQYIYQNTGQYMAGSGVAGVGLNGFTSPSFSSLDYEDGLDYSPSTDLQFTPPAPPQELSLEPKNLNFGTTTPQGPITMCVTASSVGGPASTLHVTGFSLTGSTAYTMVSAPPVGTAIPVGGSVQYCIQFLPFSNGTLTGTFHLTTDGVDSGSQTVGLTGIGAVPDVSYSGNTMFRGVDVELTDTSKVQYLYVNSTGGGPLTVNSVSFIGLNANDYFITHMPASSIPSGGVDSIGVRFAPTLEGLPDAHMVINSTAANTPWDTVLMFGVGILPHLAVSSANAVSIPPNPLKVSFDSVKIGTDSCLNITVSNPGSDTLAIERNFFTFADVDFSMTPITGKDTLIPPGGSQSIQVCFDPVSQGFRTATLRLVTNIPHTETTPAFDTSEYDIVIIGTGVPTGQLLITGMPIGSSPVGKSKCVTDTIWNTGSATLTVTNVSIGGANASDFDGTYNPPLPFQLAANAHQTFMLCATPSDTGTQTALLTGFATSGATLDTARLNLSVYGTSTGDTVILTQPFAELTCQPGLDTATIAVTNTGNTPTAYLASLAGANAGDFTILQPNPSDSEQAGGVATFKVVFNPTLLGNETANFIVTGGAGGAVTLNATGGAASIAGNGNAPLTTIGTINTFSVTVDNTGTCDWTPGDVAVNAPFAYLSGGSTLIPATGTGTLMFTFAPTSAGTFSSPVTFSNSTGVSIPAANVVINGTATSEGVLTVSAASGYSLDQNYPNPFNDESNLEITLPAPGLVQLSIVDVQGNVVENVLNRQFDAGTYSVTLSAEGLASGTYYYQMSAGGVTLTRQMVIVK